MLEQLLAKAQLPVVVGLTALLLWLESRRPLHPAHPQRVRHGAANLALFVIGTVVSGLAIQKTFELAALERELPLHRAGGEWVQLVAGVLLLDGFQYLRHRLMHRLPPLWRAHRVHHADPVLDVTSNYRLHPLDYGLAMIMNLAVVAALGVGGPALRLWLLLNGAVALLQHANVRLPWAAERAIRLVFASPGMHRVHHSREVRETDTNFGSVFSFWDRLFGTYLRPDPSRNVPFGLAEFDAPEEQTVGALLTNPFREAPVPVVKPVP
ncbi:MAG: sterol desaturase family protein [Myxococcales bacterium]